MTNIIKQFGILLIDFQSWLEESVFRFPEVKEKKIMALVEETLKKKERKKKKFGRTFYNNSTVTHQSKFRMMVFKPWKVIRHPIKNQRRILKFLNIKEKEKKLKMLDNLLKQNVWQNKKISH